MNKQVFPHPIFDFQDEHGLPVDQTGDGGDSAMRAGMIGICGGPALFNQYFLHELNTGRMVRHPYQEPWNNYKNFSRDQLLCLLATADSTDSFMTYLRFLQNGWLCQNTERDWPGSTKYPYPHKVDGQWRLFDGPDRLLPHQKLMFYKKAQIEPPKTLKWLGENSMDLALWYHGKSDPSEENQMIAQCHVFGLLKEYKKVRPDWKQRLEKYWIERRNQPKLCKLIVDYIGGF